MAPQDREKLIIEESTRYFADHGLGGGTIELARRLGIAQPLLYRYFPTKQALIKRVFDSLFPSNDVPAWEAAIRNDELELVQSLHASIYRVGFRKWVHTPPLQIDTDALIEKS
jgi:AcrR family transcriptional regulator